MVEDWAERSCEANDRCLQDLFRTVLATSAQLPARQTHAGRSFVPPATAGRQPSALLHLMSRRPRRSTAAKPTLGQSSASIFPHPTP